MKQPELIEYYWNEISECGEFAYEHAEGVYSTDTRPQPLKVEASLENYWKDLQWYLKTQGAM